MGQSSHILKRTMRFQLLVLSALVAVGLANEDVFLKWAKEQGKQYKTKAELTMRQAIFMQNYNRMEEQNTTSSTPTQSPLERHLALGIGGAMASFPPLRIRSTVEAAPPSPPLPSSSPALLNSPA